MSGTGVRRAVVTGLLAALLDDIEVYGDGRATSGDEIGSYVDGYEQGAIDALGVISRGVDTVPSDVNYVRVAVEAGQLDVRDAELDDVPDSPTEGMYFMTYVETKPIDS